MDVEKSVDEIKHKNFQINLFNDLNLDQKAAARKYKLRDFFSSATQFLIKLFREISQSIAFRSSDFFVEQKWKEAGMHTEINFKMKHFENDWLLKALLLSTSLNAFESQYVSL